MPQSSNLIVFILVVANCIRSIQCLAGSVSAVTSTNTGVRALRLVSKQPLVFTIDNFVTAEVCATLQEPAESETCQEARLQFAMTVASELFQGQWGPTDGLRFNYASSADDNNNDASSGPGGSIPTSSSCPEGLHVDTNNDSTFRSVTAILYLNSIQPSNGGATLFPVANVPDDDPSLAAAQRLLKASIAHTRGAADSTLPAELEADGAFLEAITTSAATNTGLSVQPEVGRLCIFFSRSDNGEIDPRSWHGGERLCPNNTDNDNEDDIVEKRILTLFKEVHYGVPHPSTYETTFEDYLAPQISMQRQSLLDLAASHAPFFQ